MRVIWLHANSQTYSQPKLYIERSSSPREHVVLRLTDAEALVLFEWLTRNEGIGSVPPDDCEQVVLWRIEGQLEKELVDPFRPDYRQAVDEARKEVLGSQ